MAPRLHKMGVTKRRILAALLEGPRTATQLLRDLPELTRGQLTSAVYTLRDRDMVDADRVGRDPLVYDLTPRGRAQALKQAADRPEEVHP